MPYRNDFKRYQVGDCPPNEKKTTTCISKFISWQQRIYGRWCETKVLKKIIQNIWYQWIRKRTLFKCLIEIILKDIKLAKIWRKTRSHDLISSHVTIYLLDIKLFFIGCSMTSLAFHTLTACFEWFIEVSDGSRDFYSCGSEKRLRKYFLVFSFLTSNTKRNIYFIWINIWSHGTSPVWGWSRNRFCGVNRWDRVCWSVLICVVVDKAVDLQVG